MCGDSHLPPAPESGDLIAIIHPVTADSSTAQLPSPPLSRTNSDASTTLPDSSRWLLPSSISGRLRLSNRRSSSTLSEFTHDHNSSLAGPGVLNVRVHKFGSPLQLQDRHSIDGDGGNPILHQFYIDTSDKFTSGVRLDLGVGGDGLVGRTVSIADSESRVLGEGIIGRI